MGTRGRKSSDELATMPQRAVQREPRLSPPPNLTGMETEVWWRIVGCYPANHFSESDADMLAAYCCECVTHQRVRQLRAQAESSEEIDIAKYQKIHNMQEKAARAIASLAVRLGIAKTTAHDKKGNTYTTENPWEPED